MAGVLGAGTIGAVFLTALAKISHDACTPPTSNDEFDDGPDFSCIPVGLTLGTTVSIAAGVSAVVFTGLAGDRWAKDEIRQGHILERRRSTGYILGGFGLRAAGLGMVVGSIMLPDRTLLSASMLSAGLAMRWTGFGMFTYGVRHRASARRLAARPYVQPGLRGGAMVGLSGRF